MGEIPSRRVLRPRVMGLHEKRALVESLFQEVAIDVTSFPLVEDIRVTLMPTAGVQLTVACRVPDRERDVVSMIEVSFVEVLDWYRFEDMRAGGYQDALLYVAEMVRRCVKYMVLHEVDECFSVSGVRVFDPHREVGTRVPTSP